MTIWQISTITLTVVLNSIGQVLFKYASGKIDLEEKGIIFGVLLNPSIILALGVYVVATISWVFAVKEIPLRFAYPFTAFAYLLVPLLASVVFDEQLSFNTFLGAAIIIAGVYVSLQ